MNSTFAQKKVRKSTFLHFYIRSNGGCMAPLALVSAHHNGELSSFTDCLSFLLVFSLANHFNHLVQVLSLCRPSHVLQHQCRANNTKQCNCLIMTIIRNQDQELKPEEFSILFFFLLISSLTLYI